MITYNHEAFINEAIQGVLKQKISFDFEFIIANDASSDKTDLNIQEVLENHPEVDFKYYNHSKNKGMIDNFLFALASCNGKYIALCEGDDYWIDPLKLQKQIDFLESHPDYEMCFTNIEVVNSSGKKIKDRLIINPKKYSFTHKDMVIWAPTLTRVFLNRDFSVLNKPSPGMDTLMLVYQSTLGKINFLDEVTGSYRVHDGGVFSKINIERKYEHKIKTSIACLSFVQKEYKKKYVGEVLKNLLELKALDIRLYKQSCTFILNEIQVLANMPLFKKISFWFCFNLIKLPFLEKYDLTKKLTKKTINRVLVY
jgi:glycosyltransferase involved in cell wall biosynthesis